MQKAKQSPLLRSWADATHPEAKEDLATLMIARCRDLLIPGGTQAAVTTRYWFFLGRYEALRRRLLSETHWHFFAELGTGAFGAISGEVVNVSLACWSESPPSDSEVVALDATGCPTPKLKSLQLAEGPITRTTQSKFARFPDARITSMDLLGTGTLLSAFGSALGGITTGDSARFRRHFWELMEVSGSWVKQQLPPDTIGDYRGRDSVLLWEAGRGALVRAAAQEGATIAGRGAWGRRGVAVRITGNLPATLYTGELYENIVSVIVPVNQDDLPAIWAFCSSAEYGAAVRRIDSKLIVTANTLAKVPFDVERWRAVAAAEFPDGLPEPFSDDPTQWLFRGVVAGSRYPLQVAVARLVGYRWPDQQPDEVDVLADADGVVCLPAVGGESTAGERLRGVLAAAYGERWGHGLLDSLLAGVGGLDKWLRDGFFKDHCKVFANRPFVWQIWDGRADGFSALVNYHRLDRKLLERLTYNYLGNWWIGRMTDEVREQVPGAELRLVAAQELKRKLELILEGEPPYDIYVRWKSLAEQQIGWEPDLDDGVRLNIRPFMTAGVLRAAPNIKWNKDRGKNPDGSERLNDLHYTHAEKMTARGDQP